MLALLSLTGAVAGIIAGMLGVGGGIILVPALYYLFGTLGFHSPNLMQICLNSYILSNLQVTEFIIHIDEVKR